MCVEVVVCDDDVDTVINVKVCVELADVEVKIV